MILIVHLNKVNRDFNSPLFLIRLSTSATDDCDVFEDELDQTETIKVPSHCDKDTDKADTDSVFNEIESINRLDLIEDAASAASLELTNFKNLVFDQNNANGTEVGPAVRLEEVGSNEKELANSMSQQEEEQQPQQLVKNELQTVKLTNAGLDMEKSMQIQSNIAYYSSGKVHFNKDFFCEVYSHIFKLSVFLRYSFTFGTCALTINLVPSFRHFYRQLSLNIYI